MANNSCYCCERVNMMSLDSALDELGMLSTVTNSRRQYLNEQNKSKSETGNRCSLESPTKRRFQVLKYDPKYVTGVSMETNPKHIYIPVNAEDCRRVDIPLCSGSENSQSAELEFGTKYRELTSSEEVNQNRRKMVRMSRMRAGRYRRFQKPYEVPWRLNHSMPETSSLTSESVDFSQSKSNTSSPVKFSTDMRLTRSRSLSNLDFSKLNISDFFENDNPRDKEEMEKVSHHLENLHVNDHH